MKIRMDFVTNSSSSSFVAMLEATLDNGEQLTASAETSQGGEEGGCISTEPTDYGMDISQIAPMDDLARNIYNVDGQKRHIVSGSLRLMCHTYGEYAFEANPREMMSRYLGKAWGAVIDEIDTSLDQKKAYEKLREISFLKKYTDDSLWSLIKYAYDEGYYSDTEIVHTLYRDGSLDLEIVTGEDLFDTGDVFTTSWTGHRKGGLSFQRDPERAQRRISITLGEDYYSGTEDEIQVIIQEHQKKYASFYSQMEKEAERSIAEYLAPNHFLHPNTMNFALANLDLNEVVSFQGKHFLISLNSKSIKFRQAVEREIKRRGGIPQALGYGELRKDTDYLVMSPHVSNFAALGSDVRRALEKKKEGYPVKIITEYQLWRGFMDPAIPVTSDEDAVGFIADKCKDNIDLKVVLEAKMKKAEVYGYEDAFEAAVNHLDADAKIDFWDKHFVLSGFAETEGAFIDRIQTRGGIVHGKMVKKADYLVINMETPGTAKLREALMWRDSGSTCSIVSDYQLVQAFDRILPVDPEMLRQREKEAAQQKAKKQATAQRTVQEREQARRQHWEEKQRQAEEARQLKDAERRKRYEAKLQAEAEKRRQQAEKAKARAEQQRLVEEAKAQKEQARQEAAANAVILYAPGGEPENLRKRLNTLFEKLDDAYPDKKISRLNQDHKKWGETVTELYRLLGYPDSQSFLEAYGYTVEKNTGGRPASVDPVAIMEELRRRYPNGGAESMDALKNDNPDIPWKTLSNNAREYYGATLVAYLKQVGILGKSGNKAVGADSMVDATLEAVNRLGDVELMSVSSETEPSSSMAPAENDEDSWIQAIAAETPLQDEEVLYLRTIHQLFQSAENVRMIDVAKGLQQGTGKVSYWMKKLREKGILDTTPKGVITLLKPANTKDAVSKEEVTDRGCEAADSLGEPDRVPFISHDDVGGIKQLDEGPEEQFVVSEPVQREEMNKTAPGEKEQPIAEKQEELGGEKGFSSDAKLENANVQNKSKRVKPLDELLEIIEEIRRRYPEGTSEADMNTLKQKNKDIPWQMLAGNAKRVLGKPLVPYLEEIGVVRKEMAVQQASDEPQGGESSNEGANTAPENDITQEHAQCEAEEQELHEVVMQAQREASEKIKREQINSLKARIAELNAEMKDAKGLLGAFKRKIIQTSINELTEQMNKLLK